MNGTMVWFLDWLRRRHPTDEELAIELERRDVIFGLTWQHCRRCKPCHDRWMIALGRCHGFSWEEK